MPDRHLSPESPVPLEPQRHGGALRQGSQKGGAGGPGALPSVIRQRMRNLVGRHLCQIERVLESDECTPEQKMKAFDLCAKYGVGVAKAADMDDVRRRLSETLVILNEMLPPDFAQAVLDRIEKVWRQ